MTRPASAPRLLENSTAFVRAHVGGSDTVHGHSYTCHDPWYKAWGFREVNGVED
jgi:hypothetical protein